MKKKVKPSTGSEGFWLGLPTALFLKNLPPSSSKEFLGLSKKLGTLGSTDPFLGCGKSH